MDVGHAVRLRGVSSRNARGVSSRNAREAWGAQLWVGRRQVWLGTFRTQFDAALAYDRASLKLRRYFSLNFPSILRNAEEMRFQSMYSFDTIITMIRHKTYSSNFVRFLSNEAVANYQAFLAGSMSGQQSSVDTGNGVSEASEPVVLFGARIG